MAHLTAESARAAALKRWEGKTPEQRTAETEKTRAGRATVADVLAELRALRAEIAELRSERVAA